MVYTFRYRTGPLSCIVENEYDVDASCLDDAVDQFKRHVAGICDKTLVVSYYYFVRDGENVSLNDFSYSSYLKNFIGL